jgi:hypothetical protein
MRRILPLTDQIVRNLAPNEKLYKKFYQNGLYVEVTPLGTKTWRVRYSKNGAAWLDKQKSWEAQNAAKDAAARLHEEEITRLRSQIETEAVRSMFNESAFVKERCCVC